MLAALQSWPSGQESVRCRLHLVNENLTRFTEKFLSGDTRVLPTDALQSDTCHATYSRLPPWSPIGEIPPDGPPVASLDIGYISTDAIFYSPPPLTPGGYVQSQAYVPTLLPGAISDTNQQRHSHVIGFYVMLSRPGSYAAPDFVYLFSVVVNSRYSADGGIKAYGSAELIKSVDLLLRNFLAFFRPYASASAYAGIRQYYIAPPPPREREIRSHWQLEVSRVHPDGAENRLRMHRGIAAPAFLPSLYIGR